MWDAKPYSTSPGMQHDYDSLVSNSFGAMCEPQDVRNSSVEDELEPSKDNGNVHRKSKMCL